MKRWRYLWAVPLAFIQIPGPVAWAQGATTPLPAALAPAAAPAAPDAPAYSQEQLEQILAPIALYPDELLTQVLAASTYPLEIVTADRWVKQPANAALKGDALMKALNAEDWDPSVKSLIPFPTVLNMMSEQLDWTQKLGDAFLAQQADVLAAVQALRRRAKAAGKLETNAQQVVSEQPVTGSSGGAPTQAIIIAPAQTDTVYVPAYNPTVVYGSWPYPAYPPAYYPPPVGYVPGAALMTGLAFGAGVAIAGGLWGWGSPNWGHGDININSNRYNNINANRSGRISGNTWQHNPEHRRGVAYSNDRTRNQYQPSRGGNAAQRDAFRGRTPGANGPGQRPSNGAPGANRPGQGAGNHGPRANGPGQRPDGNTRPGTSPGRQPAARPTQNSRPQAARQPSHGGGAFGGVNHGATTRAQANRGQASRSAAAPHRGGGGHGGGGRGGGGGRRR